MPRSNASKRSRAVFSDRLAGVVLVAGGLLLVAVGGVQAAAAIDIFLGRSQLALPLPDDRASHPIDAAVMTAPWAASAEDLVALAWSKSWLGTQSRVQADNPALGSALIASAVNDASRAIAIAPGYSFGWLVLADLKRESGAPPAEIAQLVVTSILSAPVEPAELVSRLTLGFSAYAGLDDDGRELLASQIRMAWRHIPKDLVDLVRKPDRVNRLFLVRTALASDPASLADFETSLGKLR